MGSGRHVMEFSSTGGCFSGSLTLKKTGEILLKGHTNHSVAYLPRHGLLVVSDEAGLVNFYDLLQGCSPLSSSNISTSPITCSVINNKLVFANDCNLSVRGSLGKGKFFLETAFQTYCTSGHDHVTIELLPDEVPLLLNELKSLKKKCELTLQIEKTLVHYLTDTERNDKREERQESWQFCLIQGPLDGLIDIFKSLCSVYTPSNNNKSVSRPDPSLPPASSSLPVLSAIRLRLLLLHPHFTSHLCNLERGEDKITPTDVSYMFSEGVRRLAYSNWPHKKFLWAEPIKMSQAGLFPILNTNSTVTSLAHSRGDRVTCFTCGMYVHHWLPTDEPWSEHTRHSPSCPFVRGQFTANVPTQFTEATHPSVQCSNHILLLSTTSSNSKIMATLSSDGLIQLWDIGKSLFIQELSNINLYQELHNKGKESKKSTHEPNTPQRKTSPTSQYLLISDYIQEILAISSLCVVTIESKGHTFLTATPCNTSLLIGCTVKEKEEGKIVSAILVYSINDSTSNSLVNKDENKTKNNISFHSKSSIHVFSSLEEGQNEGVDEENEFYKLLHELEENEETMEKFLPFNSNSTIQTIKYQNDPVLIQYIPLSCYISEAKDHTQFDSKDDSTSFETSDHTHFPLVTNIISLDSSNGVAITVTTATKSKTGHVANGNLGTLLVYNLTEINEMRVGINMKFVKKVEFTGHEETIRIMISINYNEKECLLSCVTYSGIMKVFSVSQEGINQLAKYEECTNVSHIVYCNNERIAIITVDGLLILVDIKEYVIDKEENILSTIPDISTIKQLSLLDTNGMSYTAYSPSSWIEIHPLRNCQHSPRHMLYTQDQSSIFTSQLFNTKVWEYIPQLAIDRENKYVFELRFPPEKRQIGSLKIQLKLATPTCISDSATLTLLSLNENHTSPTLLCGPIYIKEYIDITELSLTISLSHLSFLISHPLPIILITISNLFKSDYVTTEIYQETTPNKDETLVNKKGWRTRVSTGRSKPKLVPILRTRLEVSVFSYNGSLSLNTRKKIVPLLFTENVIKELILCACGYHVEENELSELGMESQGSVVKKDQGEEFNALDMLCWISSIACCNSDQSHLTLIISLVFKCLNSLLFNCFFSSNHTNKGMSQKCAQFITILTRKDKEDDIFQLKLSQSLIHLLHNLPLIPFSSSLYWLIHLLTHHCSITTISSSHVVPLLIQQLVAITSEQLTRDNSLTQLLMTGIHKDGTIFDNILFDLPFSQLTMTDSVSITTPPITTGSSYSNLFDSQFPSLPSTKPSSSKTPLHNDTNTTNIVYDPESLVLLENSQRGRQKKQKDEEKKREEMERLHDTIRKDKQLEHEIIHPIRAKDNNKYSTFSNGSHLLHSQQLDQLHTLPLSYTVSSLPNGTSIKEIGITNKDESMAKFNTIVMLSYDKPQTLGYNFPIRTSDHTHITPPILHDVSQVCPLLTNIISTPKEMWLTAESCKPGVCYSSVIDFQHVITLTHLHIPANSNISSVQLEVWPSGKEEESHIHVIASSMEISTRSLIIGDLTTPISCQYLRVTCVCALHTTNDKCIFSLGKYHGKPHLTDVDHTYLKQLEKSVLSQYLYQKEKLIELLSKEKPGFHHTYSSLRQDFSQQLFTLFTQCRESQITYNRLRNIALQQQKVESSTDCFHTSDLKVDLSSLSLDKLMRLSSSLIDTILVLSNDPNSHPAHSLINTSLTETSVRELFLSIMIHTLSTSEQARLSAVLVMYCGNRKWWSRLLAGLVKELFSDRSNILFNKERAILQLSILYQLTANHNPSVLEPLFSLLADTLSPLISTTTTTESNLDTTHCDTNTESPMKLDNSSEMIKESINLETNLVSTESAIEQEFTSTHSDPTTTVPINSTSDPIDTSLIQWITILLSHLLADENDENDSEDANTFIPSPLIPKERTKNELVQKIKELFHLVDKTLRSLNEYGHYFDERQKGRCDKMKQKMEKKKKLLTKLTEMLEQEKGVANVDKELRHIDSMSLHNRIDCVVVTSNILIKVMRGLMSLLVRYCNCNNWIAIPATCKVFMHLLLLISKPFLLNSSHIKSLILASSSLTDNHIHEWACQSLQTLIVDISLRQKSFFKGKSNHTITTLARRIQLSLKILQIASHLGEDPITSNDKQLVLLRQSLAQVEGTLDYYKEGTIVKCFPLLVRGEEKEKVEEKGKEEDKVSESSGGESDDCSTKYELEKDTKDKEVQKVVPKRILRSSKSSTNLKSTFKQKLPHKTSLPSPLYPPTTPSLPPVIESHDYNSSLSTLNQSNTTSTFLLNDTPCSSIPVLSSTSSLSHDVNDVSLSSQPLTSNNTLSSPIPILDTIPQSISSLSHDTYDNSLSSQPPSLSVTLSSLSSPIPILHTIPHSIPSIFEIVQQTAQEQITPLLEGANLLPTPTDQINKTEGTTNDEATNTTLPLISVENKTTSIATGSTIYSSSLVSNTVLEYCQSSLLLPVELKLQVKARDRYMSLLEAMQYAYPFTYERDEGKKGNIEKIEEKVEETNYDELKHKTTQNDANIDQVEKYSELKVQYSSVKTLLDIFDQIFISHSSYSSLYLPSFLQFWLNIAYASMKRISKKHLLALITSNSGTLLLSHTTVSLLIDLLLLVEESNSQTLTQSIFFLLHVHIKVSQELCESKETVDCTVLGFDGSKLRLLLWHYFIMDTTSEGKGGEECDVVFGKLLARVAKLSITFSGEKETQESKEEGKEKEVKEKEKGINMLLTILLEILKNKKSKLSLTPYLSSLFHILTQSTTLTNLIPFHLSTLLTIKQLINTTLSLLVTSVCPTSEMSYVTLWGAVSDVGERNRRPYYSVSSSLQDLKWAKREVSYLYGGINSTLLAKLMKFLKKLLSLSIPLFGISEMFDEVLKKENYSVCENTHDTSIESTHLTSPCDHIHVHNTEYHTHVHNTEDHTHVHNTEDHSHSNELYFAKNDKPLIDLIVRDRRLLLVLLQSLSSIHNKSYSSIKESGSSTNNLCILLLKDFVSFLEKSCVCFTCFHFPLIKLMESYCNKDNLRVNKATLLTRERRKKVESTMILNLLKKFIMNAEKENIEEKCGKNADSEHVKKNDKKKRSEKLKDEKKRELGEEAPLCKDQESFIRKGGGVALIKCLITSTANNNVKAPPTDHTLQHVITSLGVQDTLLPYKEGSTLINFFPKATVSATPSNISLHDLQMVNLKDTPGRSIVLQYTYPKDDNWLKINITLKQPIILHSIHLYQPVGSSQNGPSMIKVDVIKPSNLGNAMPLAPPLNTTGLTGIRIECTVSPIIIKAMCLSLYRPAVTDKLCLSNLLLLGTTVYDIQEMRKEEEGKIDQLTHPSDGWLSILNDFIDVSHDNGRTLYTSISHNDDLMYQLINSCVSLMEQKPSPLGHKQLHSFLLHITSFSHDIALTLILTLFKAQFTTPPTDVTMTTKGHIIQLLLDLLPPDTVHGIMRIVSVIRLLSDLLSTDKEEGLTERKHISSVLSPMIRVLANAIWIYEPHSPHTFIEGLNENLFKSLISITYSEDTSSFLKSSLNSLLTSLCKLQPQWFIDHALNSAQALLEELPLSHTARILHSLAHLSLSDQCIELLLSSTLLKTIIKHINDMLLNIGTLQGITELSQSLRSLCVKVAFLTDLAYGHKIAQQWLVSEDNTLFWPLLIQVFNEPSESFNENELLFCQNTIQQYFTACILFNEKGKQQFVNLLVNAIMGKYSLETPVISPTQESPLHMQITPFIRTLLINQVLGPEHVNLILNFSKELLETANNKLNFNSLIPLYDWSYYHPSYQLATYSYYTQMTTDNTLSELCTLFLIKEDKTSTRLRRLVKSEIGGLNSKVSTTGKSQTINPLLQINIFNPDVIYNKLTPLNSMSSPPTCTGIYFTAEDGTELPFNMSMNKLHSALYDGTHTKIIQVTNTPSISLSSIPSLSSYCSSLEIFTNNNGLVLLAEIFPHIYPGKWSMSMMETNTIVNLSRLPVFDLTQFLHPHSFVMLGLGMRLKEYGEVIRESNGYILLQGLLGNTEEIEKQFSSSNKEFLSILPFLYLYTIIQRSPGYTTKGHDLRQRVYRTGIIQHVLTCLSAASNIKPRKEREGEKEENKEQNVSGKETKHSLSQKSKNTHTTTSSDKEYWAKGTGFGTGSTTSRWDINTTMSQHHYDELMIAVCLAIIGEWIKVEEEIEKEDENKQLFDDSISNSSRTNSLKDPPIATPNETPLSIVVPTIEQIPLQSNDSFMTDGSISISTSHPTLNNEITTCNNGSISDTKDAITTTDIHVPNVKVSTLTTDQSTEKEKEKFTIVDPTILSDESVTIDDTGTTVYDLLKDSCLLPTLAHYINNDSILDISKHTQVYKAAMLLLLSITSNPTTQSLLFINIHESDDHTHSHSLSTLLKHLHSVALTYNKTVVGKQKTVSNIKSVDKEELKITSSSGASIRNQETTTNNNNNDIELSEVINLILQCGDIVSSLLYTTSVQENNEDDNDVTTISNKNDYIEAMRPLQFDTYPITQPDPTDNTKLLFTVPYHYIENANKSIDVNLDRGRRLAQEVSSLVTSLPLSSSSSVFVCCDEDRLDVMKVLITGPSDTPYANGCFLFDVYFPSEYPSVPMCVNLSTTGLGTVRFNPNLYNDGKVCLSVLNTWHGRPEEKWNSSTSSLLQVLVSIQSLILVSEPYFNEPGYEQYRDTPYGNIKSLLYNANICVATIQWAMIDLIRKPPDCFKKIILKHFYLRSQDILQDCTKWKRQLIKGIHDSSTSGSTSSGNNVQLRNHLTNFMKQTKQLTLELTNIKPSDF